MAVRRILDLNSGFLSSKKTLNKKELVKYVKETIQRTSIYDYSVKKKSDKIFPPCPFIREQLHRKLAVEEKNFIKEKGDNFQIFIKSLYILRKQINLTNSVSVSKG